ncbi:BhlA-like holin [Orenia metallireducens]|uniref:BhlA holin family protein n=2 Tax=Orenia metallireducens TaxID=1413210 RepID=A0A285I3B9_9FIRM|nr:BhlA/UviB family holin-like peptide [Orenia metallireducens]PRX23113.1 BhlA-like holin [Orenia metallireducens]SNY42357.1 BhlA holin family protein [Orenia metallireducens]
MESKVLDLALSQGIWAVLAVVLIFYILKAQEKRDLKQEEREEKYQNIITQLTDKLNIVEIMKDDLNEIKDYLYKN